MVGIGQGQRRRARIPIGRVAGLAGGIDGRARRDQPFGIAGPRGGARRARPLPALWHGGRSGPGRRECRRRSGARCGCRGCRRRPDGYGRWRPPAGPAAADGVPPPPASRPEHSPFASLPRCAARWVVPCAVSTVPTEAQSASEAGSILVSMVCWMLAGAGVAARKGCSHTPALTASARTTVAEARMRGKKVEEVISHRFYGILISRQLNSANMGRG